VSLTGSTTSLDATNLHYEISGRGVPVLLVMGLGMTADAWWRTTPVLADSYRVIAFDNRGVGRSDRPPGPYTLAQMAHDAVAVLDAAGVDRAHVYGISMGGMIAQEVALRYPGRVRALVLGATTAGGESAVAPDEQTLSFLRRRPSMPAEEGAWASVPYVYSARTRERHAERIGEDVVRRLATPLDPAGYLGQLAAASKHDCVGRLREVSAPTLVVHGLEDRLIPQANGRILADSIPGARLLLLEEAAHLYTTDEPQADREVLRFIASST
jgi:pimeloyl-ACP methyl ester carboxylesterase